jgi:hypothetical protein
MLDVVFTIDYEIYGSGEGSLQELVHEPAKQLGELFRRHGKRFVLFVEVAELEMMEAAASDSFVGAVKNQVRQLRADGMEVGLHLHPQWYNGVHNNDEWQLDYSEYNLCQLDDGRMNAIVDRALAYLRDVVADESFVPLSFRAGNWLLQPSEAIARVLAAKGIRVDSSVFKGGLQTQHHLDYRRALDNDEFWWFSKDVEVPDPSGVLLELPIYTRMVFPWNMYTSKRAGLQRKGSADSQRKNAKQGWGAWRDRMRVRYPKKLDFCRMQASEWIDMLDEAIAEDQTEPGKYRPIVAIGHTKDLVDFETVDAMLRHLAARGIRVATLSEVYERCKVVRSELRQGYEAAAYSY